MVTLHALADVCTQEATDITNMAQEPSVSCAREVGTAFGVIFAIAVVVCSVTIVIIVIVVLYKRR